MEIIKLYREGGWIKAVMGDSSAPKATGIGSTVQEALDFLMASVHQIGDEKLNLEPWMELQGDKQNASPLRLNLMDPEAQMGEKNELQLFTW